MRFRELMMIEACGFSGRCLATFIWGRSWGMRGIPNAEMAFLLPMTQKIDERSRP